MERKTDGEKDGWRERQIERKTDGEKDRSREIQFERKTERLMDGQTYIIKSTV